MYILNGEFFVRYVKWLTAVENNTLLILATRSVCVCVCVCVCVFLYTSLPAGKLKISAASTYFNRIRVSKTVIISVTDLTL